MGYPGGNKADSIISDVWPNHYYSNKNYYRHQLLKKLELHLRDLNNQIKELTFENIKLRNIYGK